MLKLKPLKIKDILLCLIDRFLIYMLLLSGYNTTTVIRHALELSKFPREESIFLMTQNLFTLFPKSAELFYGLSRCIVVVVFIL